MILGVFTLRGGQPVSGLHGDRYCGGLTPVRDGHPGRNRSRLIRDAVKDYVSRLERATEDEREAGIVRRHKSKLALQSAAAVKAQAAR